jgi:hypothetical protein
MRDRKLTRQLVKDFALLWPIRHSLAKSVGKRVEAEMPAGFTDAVLVSRTPSVPKVEVVVKAKPRKVAKSVYAEYEKIRKYLRHLDSKSQLAHESWGKPIAADRQEALRRQRVLLSIIEAGK